MYKKVSLLSTLLCTLIQCAPDLTSWLEIKPSYFFCNTSPMSRIYHDGCFELQASASIPLRQSLDFYGSIGWRTLCGYALNTCQKTSLTVVPLDIGLKPLFSFRERGYYFFAIGPRFFFFNQQNSSSSVDPIINGAGVGLFVNTGFNILLADHFLLGIFGEYSYEKKTICPSMPNVYSNGSVQIGGFAFGASVGYAF